MDLLPPQFEHHPPSSRIRDDRLSSVSRCSAHSPYRHHLLLHASARLPSPVAAVTADPVTFDVLDGLFSLYVAFITFVGHSTALSLKDTKAPVYGGTKTVVTNSVAFIQVRKKCTVKRTRIRFCGTRHISWGARDRRLASNAHSQACFHQFSGYVWAPPARCHQQTPARAHCDTSTCSALLNRLGRSGSSCCLLARCFTFPFRRPMARSVPRSTAFACSLQRAL